MGHGTALARIMDEQGRRSTWVAQQLRVDKSTVSRWKTGTRPIPQRRKLELARLLGESLDEQKPR